MGKLTTNEFIEKAKSIHGNKYNYSKVEYKNCDTKVCIICPEHGEFWQTPYNHYHEQQGCPKCSGKYITTSEFIEKVRKVHGDKYDYSKLDLEHVKNREKNKVCIICPEHGEFWQTPNSHLNGCGCPLCGIEKRSKKHSQSMVMPIERFIKRAKEVHGNKYDYSKVNYKTTNDKVCIICPEHGEFWQVASKHINSGNGCPKCHPNHKRTTSEFIEKAREVHGDKYDYSKVEYKNNVTHVCIICPEHGEFWQRPNSHISRKQGCPKCAESKLEESLRNMFINENVNFTSQKTFEDVKFKAQLRYDFYDETNKILYECQGIQHIRNCSDAFGNNYFIPLLERDKIKFEKAKEKNIQLKYIVEKKYYNEFISFGGIYTKENVISIVI